MKEVHNILDSKVDQQTVETLEGLLSSAKAGQLKSLMFVDQYQDGTVGSGWAGSPSMRMIADLRSLEFKFFSEMYFEMG